MLFIEIISFKYTPLTRARTVSVFRQCVSALFMVKDQHPQAVKEATASVLPVWIEAFKVLLSMDPRQDVQDSASWDNLAIRIQIFKVTFSFSPVNQSVNCCSEQTLDTIHMSFSRALTPHLGDLLTSALSHLHGVLPTFVHYYLSPNSPAIPRSSEEEPIELSQFGCPIIDFVSSVIRGGKAKGWLEPTNMEALVTAILGWIQMTGEDVSALEIYLIRHAHVRDEGGKLGE